MNRISIVFWLSLLVLPGVALAQASGTSRPRSPRTERAFDVTRTLNGIVVEVNVLDNSLVVEDERGQRHMYWIDARTKFEADKRSALAEIDPLLLDDFRAGEEVKVTFRVTDNTATKVKARRPETRVLKGTIAEVNLTEQSVLVQDEQGRHTTYWVDAKTQFKADKRSLLSDRQRLTLRGFQVGVPIELKFRVADRTATELKARR